MKALYNSVQNNYSAAADRCTRPLEQQVYLRKAEDIQKAAAALVLGETDRELIMALRIGNDVCEYVHHECALRRGLVLVWGLSLLATD